MVLRALAFLAVVVLLAFVAFQILVENEIRRVVSVHALDKADHLVDLFEERTGRVASMTHTSMDPNAVRAFAEMAHAIHIPSVYLYRPDGSRFGKIDTAKIAEAAEAGRGHAGHGTGEDHADDHMKALLAELPAPGTDALRPLIDGEMERYISIGLARGEDGCEFNYAVIVEPVLSGTGQLVGYLGFNMNVSHIHGAYASGVRTFAMLFLMCGIILFGVPSLAFWLQKRLADRSSRDAKYLSRHDALTGLLNRSAFVEEAGRWLAEGRIGHAAYVDADRFKLINDTHGHTVGDAYLRHIAGILKARCGPEALVARLGGDEFTIVLPEMRPSEARARIEGMRRDAARDVEIDGVTLAASISVGVAEPREGDCLDELLQRADTALYFAKAGGRNAVSYFTDEMGEAARRRRFLELRLREGCRNGDFALAYQPLVDAGSGEVLGYEALLRLREPDGTPIPPSEFVPIAEEIGLIEEIGHWVLRTATREIAALDDRSRVSVNLSADQFNSGRLVDIVAEALADAGLPPERLELEITESVLLDEDSRIEFQIDALKEMGVSFAMDDFGTGYSSLSTLWKYGFDRIKIDRSFVQALEDAPERSRLMIEAIVLLGNRMGMSITAEGIEKPCQRELLAGLGCNVLQGFLFGYPEPIAFPAGSEAREAREAS